MYCEEIDWSWRVHEAGWEDFVVPQAEIVHYGGESTRQVPARSVINLWRSRAQLYRQIHPPWKVTLATWMVRLGMKWQSRARGRSPFKGGVCRSEPDLAGA
jgi:GT2 family glycosyltransferase